MNILVSYSHYPVTIAKYLVNALDELGHMLWKVGPYSPTIPWNTQRDYTPYLDKPDFEIPSGISNFPASLAVSTAPWKPDLILSIDAGFYLTNSNSTGIPSFLVMTDPHCLDYHPQLTQYDMGFCMQYHYLQQKYPYPNVRWLPYAYEPMIHYPTGIPPHLRKHDVALVSGLLYQNRLLALAGMESVGLDVFQESGLLFRESAKAYGDALISFNWSSEQDLPARVWEGFGQVNLVLTNNVPDLKLFPHLVPGHHYVVYENLNDCIEKALYYSRHRMEAEEIAWRGHNAACNETWTERAEVIIQTARARGAK